MENGKITDKQEIAEKVKDAFINIVSRITSSDQCVTVFDNVALTNFVNPKLGNQPFEIPYITEARMLDLLKKIPTSRATGCDGLSAKVLKLVAPALASSFCRLMILSICTGSFPSRWKTAQVTPLFKNGSREDTGNYRPISVLPVLSKVLERRGNSSL